MTYYIKLRHPNGTSCCSSMQVKLISRLWYVRAITCTRMGCGTSLIRPTKSSARLHARLNCPNPSPTAWL